MKTIEVKAMPGDKVLALHRRHPGVVDAIYFSRSVNPLYEVILDTGTRVSVYANEFELDTAPDWSKIKIGDIIQIRGASRTHEVRRRVVDITDEYLIYAPMLRDGSELDVCVVALSSVTAVEIVGHHE